MSTLFLTANVPLQILVEEIPGWTPLLDHLGIDYRMAGQKTLQEICAEKGLVYNEIFEKLLNYGGANDYKSDITT